LAREKDLYRILGVSENADSAKIKKAYRRAAKKYHPDVSPKGEEKFKEVQQAYETLSDPEKKALYDLETSKRSDRRGSYNPSQPLRTGPLKTGPSSFFDEIEQLFSDFWYGGSEFSGEWEEDRADVHFLEITLSPSEAKNGCEIPLEVPFWADCPRCLGTGFIEGLICGLCRGRGKKKIQEKIRIIIPPGVKNGMQVRIPLKSRRTRGVDLIATLRVSQ
jgi:molecular chaperone DnaJ